MSYRPTQKGHRSKRLGILRIIGPLPRIAQMRWNARRLTQPATVAATLSAIRERFIRTPVEDSPREYQNHGADAPKLDRFLTPSRAVNKAA